MANNALERLMEEKSNDNKEKCRHLRKVRKQIADELNIDLHQTECTYEGICSGTCPKCEQEEQILNAALLRKDNNIDVDNLKNNEDPDEYVSRVMSGKIVPEFLEKEEDNNAYWDKVMSEKITSELNKDTEGKIFVRSGDIHR